MRHNIAIQRVLFHYDPPPRLHAWVASHQGADREILCCAQDDETQFERLLPTVEVIWHVLKRITPEQVRAATNLKLIQKIGVGVNTIAVDAARERGIAVCNMPGANSRAVAEMTLLLMLAALRQLPRLDRSLRAAQWAAPGRVQAMLGELGGRTVGLVGAGQVPRLLAPWLTVMGASVIYANRGQAHDFPYQHCSLDALLSASDIVSLHLPATPDTERLIGTSQFAQMKPNAILVNTARGELVDESALMAALDQGTIAAAALDVFATEPLAANHPLLTRDDVIVSPHVAWLTNETWERSLTVALENCRRLKRAETLLNRVA